MKKPKAPSAKKLYEGLQQDYEAFRQKVRVYVLEVNRVSNSRSLMTIEPATDKGLINGMTIPELVMLVNLNEGTGEETILQTSWDKKRLLVVARKKLPRTPMELL